MTEPDTVIKDIQETFSPSDLIVVLEAARIAFADGDIHDRLAEVMDIEDEELIQIRDRLHNLMEGDITQ